MPINRKQDALDAEQAVKDLIDAGPAADASGLDSTNRAIADSRGVAADNIRTAISDVAPGAVAAAAPSIERGNVDLERANNDTQAMLKIRQRQEKVNKTANFVFARMVAANFDVDEAKKVAMQYALDEDRRASERTGNEKARQLTLEKQDIIDSFAARKAELAKKYAQDRQKKAIFNSVVGSFFGLAGTMGAGLALKGASTAAKIGGTAAAGAAASSAGSAVTSEDPSENFMMDYYSRMGNRNT